MKRVVKLWMFILAPILLVIYEFDRAMKNSKGGLSMLGTVVPEDID